ncbi:MAG: hypothetical protein V3V25_06660 [Paracoccaceae bacterium]
MRDVLLKKWIAFRHCDEGVTLVEYGIAITLAILVGGVALTALATAISGSMGTAAGAMP